LPNVLLIFRHFLVNLPVECLSPDHSAESRAAEEHPWKRMPISLAGVVYKSCPTISELLMATSIGMSEMRLASFVASHDALGDFSADSA